MADEYDRPLPFPTEDTKPFWDSVKQHSMALPYCTKCQAFYYYPRAFCPKCFSWEGIEYRTVSGKGKVYGFAICYRGQAEGWWDKTPYTVVTVELDEGPRMVSNLINVEQDPEHIRVGMPVEVVYSDVTPEMTLPHFQPAGG